MARAGGKKSNKSTAPSAPSKPVTAPTTSLPDGFRPIPAGLQPLVATLPTSHVYAIHLDTNPAALKKRVYAVPVLLNLVITAILAWRIYYAAPTYLEQIVTIFGIETAWKVNPAEMGAADLMSTITSRTGLLMIDYMLFAMLGSWPWEFLFGSKYSRRTGALEWRRVLGFQETEIVVRKGRKWDEALLSKERDLAWTVEDTLALQFKIEPAMMKSNTSKTGYLLLDKEWDLDFRAMIDAHNMVKAKKIDPQDLDHVVLLYTKNQWLVWNAHDKVAEAQLVAQTAVADTKLNVFRDQLTALGCEDVFFRWIEIIQYETSLPGGFTSSKQAEALDELKKLVTDQGVDFTTLLEQVGGQQGIPGLS